MQMVIFDFLKKFGKSLGSRTLTLRVLVRGRLRLSHINLENHSVHHSLTLRVLVRDRLGFSQINLENHSVHPNFAVELFQQSFQGWD